MKRLISDARGLLADYKTGIEVLSDSASLRIEEVKTFTGSLCLKEAQNCYENSRLLTSSTKKLVDNGAVCLAGNWSRYMMARTKNDFEFLDEKFNLVDTSAGNLVTRAAIEECYDSELRLRYFLCGYWKHFPNTRMAWLLANPNEGFRGKNVRGGAYILRTGEESLTLKERKQLRQPPIDMNSAYFKWPFFKIAIVELSQYYPEEESDLHMIVNENLELKIHFFITRLIGFSRFLHGFKDFHFRSIESACSKRAIQSKIFQQGSEKQAYINGVVPVSTLVKKILNPNTLTGITKQSSAAYQVINNLQLLSLFSRYINQEYCISLRTNGSVVYNTKKFRQNAC